MFHRHRYTACLPEVEPSTTLTIGQDSSYFYLHKTKKKLTKLLVDLIIFPILIINSSGAISNFLTGKVKESHFNGATQRSSVIISSKLNIVKVIIMLTLQEVEPSTTLTIGRDSSYFYLHKTKKKLTKLLVDLIIFPILIINSSGAISNFLTGKVKESHFNGATQRSSVIISSKLNIVKVIIMLTLPGQLRRQSAGLLILRSRVQVPHRAWIKDSM